MSIRIDHFWKDIQETGSHAPRRASASNTLSHTPYPQNPGPSLQKPWKSRLKTRSGSSKRAERRGVSRLRGGDQVRENEVHVKGGDISLKKGPRENGSIIPGLTHAGKKIRTVRSHSLVLGVLVFLGFRTQANISGYKY